MMSTQSLSTIDLLSHLIERIEASAVILQSNTVVILPQNEVIESIKNDEFFKEIDPQTREQIASTFHSKTMQCYDVVSIFEDSIGQEVKYLRLVSGDGVGIFLPNSCCFKHLNPENAILSAIFDADEKEINLDEIYKFHEQNVNEWFPNLLRHPSYHQFKYALPLTISLIQNSQLFIINKLYIKQKLASHLNKENLLFDACMNEYGKVHKSKIIFLRREYLIKNDDSHNIKMRKTFFMSIVLFHEIIHLIRDLLDSKLVTSPQLKNESGYYAELCAYNGLFSYDKADVNGVICFAFVYFWTIGNECTNLEKRFHKTETGFVVMNSYIKKSVIKNMIEEPSLDNKEIFPIPALFIRKVQRARGGHVQKRIGGCGTHENAFFYPNKN